MQGRPDLSSGGRDAGAVRTGSFTESAALAKPRRYARHVRVVFLDVDGVLNRAGFRPVESRGLVSWIEPELAARFAQAAMKLGARVVLASDWRIGRTLAALRETFATHGIAIHDVTPSACGGGRWREIAAWLAANGVDATAAAIVDDAFDMGELAARHVCVTPLRGFDDGAAETLLALFAT